LLKGKIPGYLTSKRISYQGIHFFIPKAVQKSFRKNRVIFPIGIVVDQEKDLLIRKAGRVHPDYSIGLPLSASVQTSKSM